MTNHSSETFRLIVLLLAAAADGCGLRYAGFTLPPPPGPPQTVRFDWRVEPSPVLLRGSAGEFDSSDALNPSVFHFSNQFWNLYSGFDGKSWHTGIAVSPDPSAWQKRGIVLSPDPKTWEGDYIAANGSAIVRNGEILYWYQGGRLPRIGLARSPDARNWRKEPVPVLDPGPHGSWDERGVADPYVIEVSGTLYLFYTGMDRAQRQRLGIARSLDGLSWEKLRSNPVMEVGVVGAFDEGGLGEPAVWTSHGRYWMLYTGRAWQEERAIGLSESTDGVHWKRSDAAPLLKGSGEWRSKVVCDPSVIVRGGEVLVWFGGGNVASPDEKLNGQIGLARLIARAP